MPGATVAGCTRVAVSTIQAIYRWARREQPLDDPAAEGGLVTNLDGRYPPVPQGLAQCARCAALLVEAAEPRRAHDRFHNGLWLLWERTGGPWHNSGAEGGSDPAPRRSTTVGASRRRHEKEP